MVNPNTIVQNGAQSVTILVPVVAGNNGTLGPADWAALKPGKLKDLMNRPYTSLGAGFFETAAAAGFTSAPLHYSNATNTVHTNDGLIWDLDGEGYPIASLSTADLGTYYARLQTAYSASE